MRYQPNFCNNCGEKIERPTPFVTDSTRFCDVCKDDFVPLRAAPFVFAALMAVFGVFGLGSYLQRGGEKVVNVSSKQFAANPSGAVKNPANSAAVSSKTNAAPTAPTVNNQTSAPTPNPTVKPPRPEKPNPPADEAVYFCGAPTKKGAPCSRRVRGGGRCWQHKGQTAMLGDEKLRAGQ